MKPSTLLWISQELREEAVGRLGECRVVPSTAWGTLSAWGGQTSGHA